MFFKKLFIFFLTSLFLFSCIAKKELKETATLASDLEDFEQWKQNRVKTLSSTFGWLSVTGLVWLKDDMATIGTDVQHDVTVPYSASANFGTLIKNGTDWNFTPAKDAELKIENIPLTTKVNLKHDQTGAPTIINHESLFWYLIKRGDTYGIRMKDTLNKNRFDLKSIPSFDYNPSYVIQAKVLRASSTDSILITNAQGVAIPTKLEGWLTFNFQGITHTLAGTNGGNNTWFIVYGDKTNSAETYGAGRFIYVDVPENASIATIDFNRSENPPCYFTAFATCPLPPRENKLAVRILAGEQSAH